MTMSRFGRVSSSLLAVAFLFSIPSAQADADIEQRARLLNQYLICIHDQSRSLLTSKRDADNAASLKRDCRSIEEGLEAAYEAADRAAMAQTLASMRVGAVRVKRLDAERPAHPVPNR